MAITTNKASLMWLARGPARFVARWIGAALSLATLFACLVCADLHEGSTLSLQQLEHAESTLMSCDKQPFGTGDHLWCEAPDSPLCLPALPASGRVELWDQAPYALFAAPEAAEADLVGEWLGWTRPIGSAHPPSRESARLERPPRA